MVFEDQKLFGQTFASKLGWVGYLRNQDCVLQKVSFGFASELDLLQSLTKFDDLQSAIDFDAAQVHWFDEKLRAMLLDYTNGKNSDLLDFEIEQSWMTAFQRRVVNQCREIPFGETISYGELAERSGSPRAARAVGSVMAKNRFPIVVPCHRVIATNKKIGGFSAPRGISLKQQMLELEKAACASPQSVDVYK